MAKVLHTCTECVPVDAAIIDAYVALVDTQKRALAAAEEAEAAAGHTPYIGENGNWWEWDNESEQFVDTGVSAGGGGGGSDPNAVKYTAQSLTDGQKAQARQNIAACSADAAGTVEPVETNTAVLYTAQELTVEQKAQARTNIGAGTSSFSGSYNDLTNKPTIPPLSNNLPADKSSTTKAASAKDTYDAAHPAIVTSLPAGGMLPNVYYKLGTLTGNVTFNLAEPTDPTIVNHYFFSFSAGDPVPTITWPSGIVGWASGVQPTIMSLVYYEISILDGYAAFLDV